MVSKKYFIFLISGLHLKLGNVALASSVSGAKAPIPTKFTITLI